MTASRTPSEIWSATLSGCPSVTDSEVKRYSLSESTGVVMSRGRVHAQSHSSVERRLEQLRRLPRQLEIFARLDDQDLRAIDQREPPACVVAHPCRMLADAAGEDQRID